MHMKHGFARKGQVERLHNVWRAMKKRCFSPGDDEYRRYGGRGISMCQEWKGDYVAFRTWSHENGYDPSLTIDRINNDGDYEPGNCRWTTKKEQARNRSTSRRIAVGGVTMTMAQWAEDTGISAFTIYSTDEDRAFGAICRLLSHFDAPAQERIRLRLKSEAPRNPGSESGRGLA